MFVSSISSPTSSVLSACTEIFSNPAYYTQYALVRLRAGDLRFQRVPSVAGDERIDQNTAVTMIAEKCSSVIRRARAGRSNYNTR
jgi:hypothetical protein